MISFGIQPGKLDANGLRYRIEREAEKGGFDCSPLCAPVDTNRKMLDGLCESLIKEPCYIEHPSREPASSAIGELLSLIRQEGDDIVQLYAKRGATYCGFRVKSESETKTLSMYLGLYRCGPTSNHGMLDCIAHHWMSIYSTCTRHPGLFDKYVFAISSELTPPYVRRSVIRSIAIDGNKEISGNDVAQETEVALMNHLPQKIAFAIADLPTASALLKRLPVHRFIVGE